MKTLFKIALANLLDKTETFSRNEWAKYLLVSEPAISQWTNGKTMPKAEYLKRILLYLENFERQNVQQYVYSFHRVADMPIQITLDTDLLVRYQKYQTITEYISAAYKDILDIELADVKGCYRKQLYYAFSSFAKVLIDVGNDFEEEDQISTYSKALNAITHKDFEQLLTEKLIKQLEPQADAIAVDKPNIFISYNEVDKCLVSHIANFNSKPQQDLWSCIPPLLPKGLKVFCYTSGNIIEEFSAFQKMAPTCKENDEQRYLDRLRDGDKDAFKRIFELYLKEVARYLSKVFLSQADKQEIIENAFIIVWRNRSELAKIGNFRDYLFQTVDTYLQIHQLNRIKSSDQNASRSCCLIYEDLQDGMEVVKNFNYPTL